MAENTGAGAKFSREGATQGQFEDVAQVASITPPQPSVDSTEITDLSITNGLKKFLPGQIDPGEVSITLNFDGTDTGHQALESDLYARAVKQYKITLPDGSSWQFPAFVEKWEPQDVNPGDVIQVKVTFKVTDQPTFAAGT